MSIRRWHITGFIFTLLLGSALHSIYQWTGQNKIIAIFGAVNESTWEHLKLVFIPMLLFSLIEFKQYGKELSNFIPVRTLSILISMITIIGGFYTYTGVLGKDYLWVDITLFVLAALVGFLSSYKLLHLETFTMAWVKPLGIIGLILLIIFIILFTFYPPNIPLFRDSSTGAYGV